LPSNAATGIDQVALQRLTMSRHFRFRGIFANRGVAALRRANVFVLNARHDIVSSIRGPDSSSGARRKSRKRFPVASSNYGYSPRRAPPFAQNTGYRGAAGSEYGVRGFVMAYTTHRISPRPGRIPSGRSRRPVTRLAAQTGRSSRRRSCGRQTFDTTTEPRYFGNRLRYCALLPVDSPGLDSARRLADRIHLTTTGRMKWWSASDAAQRVVVRTAQPPLVYNAKVRGSKHGSSSVGR